MHSQLFANILSRMAKTRIHFKLQFLIVTAFMLLTLPLGWVAGWFIAATVHELFHYFAVLLCGGRVDTVCISVGGAVMEGSLLTNPQKALCSLAGPLGGLLLCLLSRHFPYLSICAFFQSLYNLLPVYPLDGGQTLNAVLHHMLPVDVADTVEKYIRNTVLFLLVVVGITSLFLWKLGPIPLLAAAFVVCRSRNIACKGERKALQ